MENEQTTTQQPAAATPLMVDWQTVCVILMARFLPLGSRSVVITNDDVVGMTAAEYAPTGPVVAVRQAGPNALTLSIHTRDEAEELARQYDAERALAAENPASMAPTSGQVQ